MYVALIVSVIPAQEVVREGRGGKGVEIGGGGGRGGRGGAVQGSIDASSRKSQYGFCRYLSNHLAALRLSP